MHVCFLNDTHVGIRNSSDIFIRYQQRFYEEIFFPYLLENNIKQIIHLGDYYENRKFINFKALQANRLMFLEKLREYGITMDIIAGNHDLFYRDTSKLCSLNELLGHYMNEVNIIHKPTVLDYDGTKIGLLPWINKDNEDESFEFLKKAKANILCAHLELQGFSVSPGYSMQGGMSPEHFNRFEIVLSGHFHTKSSQNNIHYLGSQMEFFANDCDDPKYFHVLDTSTREITAVRNPITIFKKVMYDDTIESNRDQYLADDLSDMNEKFVKLVVVKKKNNALFDRYVERIQSQQIHELKIAENFDEYRGASVDDSDLLVEDTHTLVNSYVDSVDTPLDKDRIKSQVYELMTEAQSVEVS